MESSSSKDCRYCHHFPFKSPFRTPPPSLSPAFEITPTSTSYYTRRYTPPNCFALAISHGLRGAAIGSVFGGAFALSTAVSSGYRGSSLVSYTGAAALRNAAGFASWTSLYAFSRCGLVRVRGHHDLLNSAAAGAFTGGVLTVITTPQVLRYQQSALMTNMAASAMVAVVFDAVNRF